MIARTLLVAVDLGDTSRPVVDTALDYARALHARVVFAHVVPPSDTLFPEARVSDAAHPEGEPVTPLAVEHARARLTELEARARSLGVEATSAVHRGEDAAETLLDEARRHGAELMILGTHGRSGLARVLLGSVAEAVLRTTPIPVLVVRTGEHDAQEAP